MKKKLLLYGIIGLLFFSSYSFADNYNSCVGNISCLSCMCNQYGLYYENQCIQDQEQCENSCFEDINSCYDSCNEASEEDCSYCEQDCSSACYGVDCNEEGTQEIQNCLVYKDQILNNYNLDYGACYSEYLPGDGNEGGNEGGNVEGIFGDFAPIINGLKGAIFEFIPYLIYISLGLLGASIGFVGIKWLINRIRSKVFSSFK